MVVRLDRLVGNAGRASIDERVRQLVARREVQVREQDEVLAQERVLRGQRLLHLEQELGFAPDVLGAARQRGADRTVGVVEKGAALPRSGLDEDVVPALDELARTRGRQRHAVLVGLDLLDDANLHRAKTLAPAAVR
jgi:hypothetical protein